MTRSTSRLRLLRSGPLGARGRVAVALLASLATVASGATGRSEAPPDERSSLEQALERLRARRDAAREDLAFRVAELVASLDAQPTDADEARLAPYVDALSALPPDAAPLLVRHLDPGADGGFRQWRRARAVVSAIESIGVAPILAELEDLARTGSPRARRPAVALLARAGDDPRARARLEGLWRDGPGELASAVLSELLAIAPSEDTSALVNSALSSSDPERLDAALAALDQTGADAPAAIAALLAQPTVAAPRVDALLDYYAGRPDQFGVPEARLLFDLLSGSLIPVRRGARALERLPELRPDSRPRTKQGANVAWHEELRAFAERQEGALRESAQIALARLGDRAVRKVLLAPLSDRLSDVPDDVEDLMKRGLLHMRLEEPEEAVRDFGRAFELVERPLEQRKPIAVRLARGLCLLGELRRAWQVLSEIRLTDLERGELVADPDFAVLVAHERYGRVLREAQPAGDGGRGRRRGRD